MPQIRSEDHGALVNFLNAREVPHEIHMLPAEELKPTQATFDPEKVKAMAGVKGERAVLASSDGYILDGHHQWMAAKAAGEPVKTIVLDASIRDLIAHAKEFPSARTAEESAREAQTQAAAPDEGAARGGAAPEAHAGASAPGDDGGGKPAAVERLGRDYASLEEGAKPFASRKEAQTARKLMPHLRVVSADGGFALAPKTAAQLAAEEKAAKRLSLPRTSEKGSPIPAHAFIASEGGLSREAMADSGFDRNVRVGNRTLFAAAGKGMTIEHATELLKEHGYLPDGAGAQRGVRPHPQERDAPAVQPGGLAAHRGVRTRGALRGLPASAAGSRRAADAHPRSRPERHRRARAHARAGRRGARSSR
jgi:hypothetical protein